MKLIAFILANSADPDTFTALENAAGIDADGWALIAPFGRFPKTRIFKEGAQVKEQKFIQVLDNDSADAVLARENSLFGKIKRALIGLPVFKGHGDLTDHDKSALSNSATKVKLGTVDQIRKTDRGIEAHFVLDNDGADAVAAGWKFPSVLWRVAHAGTDGDAIIGTPFKLLSIALTQFPNISGVDSLANASVNEPAAKQTETNNIQDTMKSLLIGWLAAQGIVLANDAADQTVFDAFNKEMLARSSNIATLGNEKSTLSTQLTSLTSERDTQKKRADEAITTLANEQTARKADRKRAAALATDLVIQKGKLAIAQRDATITILENSADFDAEVKKLEDAAVVVKTAANAVSGKQQSALSNEQQQLQAEYQAAFKTELIEAGQNPIQAHQNIMRLPKYAGLAAKLAPKA